MVDGPTIRICVCGETTIAYSMLMDYIGIP